MGGNVSGRVARTTDKRNGSKNKLEKRKEGRMNKWKSGKWVEKERCRLGEASTTVQLM